MTFWESIPIALFSFAMVIMVLSVLYLLIRLFSYIISLKGKPIAAFSFKGGNKTSTNKSDSNKPVLTSVTDEHGNIQNFKMHISSTKENKK